MTHIFRNGKTSADNLVITVDEVWSPSTPLFLHHGNLIVYSKFYAMT